MLYKLLAPFIILLERTESREIDISEEVILLPEDNSKVYVHWIADNGKIQSTYTMTGPTKIQGKVNLTNASHRVIEIKIIDIS